MRPSAILAALATLALSAVPLAAESHDESCSCKGERRAELLKRFDANHDGKLDESERAAAKQAMQEHRREIAAKVLEKHPQFDTNGDGTLSRDEAKAGREQLREKCQAKFKENHPEAFAKVDTNGDGVIDQSERQARFLANHPGIDANGDGKISCCERKEYRAKHKDDHADNGRRSHGDPADNGHDHGRRSKDGE